MTGSLRRSGRQAVLGLSLLLAVFIVNCGSSNIFDGLADDESKEARTEEALILLDNGEYQAALNLLQDLLNDYPDDQLYLQYLSNAYAGLAGLDTINMIEVIGDLEDSGESGSIDMVGLVIGDDNGQLTSEDVAEKLDYINSAIAAMSLIDTPNSDQTIQLGLLGATHLTLTLAEIVMDDRNVDTLTLTEDGIAGLYTNPADLSEVQNDTLTTIGEDIVSVGNAVDELDDDATEQNDLSEDLADFQSSIDQNGDGDVSQAELEHFLDNL